MIKLTDLGGNEIFFNSASVCVIRSVLHGESSTNAHAALETYSGKFFVQETVADVIRKLG